MDMLVNCSGTDGVTESTVVLETTVRTLFTFHRSWRSGARSLRQFPVENSALSSLQLAVSLKTSPAF